MGKAARPVLIVAAAIAAVSIVALGLASISRGETPEWLRRKLEFETQHAEFAKQQETKCAQEVATLEKRRADAPKDEKGNPVLQGEYAPKFETVAPRDKVFVVQENTTDYLPSALRDELDITSTAYAPYDILIAANDKEDKAMAFIYDFKSNPNYYGFEEREFRFPGKGPLVLQALVDDNSIVTFHWGSGQEGFFDLRDNTATFNAYATPRE